ncbi:3713_t:CDS:2, partial [Dentiscutata heterogama]
WVLELFGRKVLVILSSVFRRFSSDNTALEITFRMNPSQRPRAKDLPCVFANLVPLYQKYGLKECEIKESQVKQHASSEATKNRLQIYNTFFPELDQIQTRLDSFSLCERHYNQLIVSNNLYQNLLNLNLVNYNFDIEPIEQSYATEVKNNNKQTNDIGIQVSDNMLQSLENHVHLLQTQLNSKTNEIEYLKKQLEYAYNYVVESWDLIQELNKINKELSEQNNTLKYSLDVSDYSKYHGLQQKTRKQLLEILQ